MKRLLLFFLCTVFFLCINAKSVVIDGVKYTLNGKGPTAYFSVSVADKNALPENLVIPAKVLIDNREYPVVKVEKLGFKGCKRLKTLILPNTISEFGRFAFMDCTSLTSVIMPDEAKAEIYEGDYGFGAGGIFKGCTALQDVRGTNVPYPNYVVYETIWECKEVPFYQTVERIGAVTMSHTKGFDSFLDYAIERVKNPIEQWQKRKDYETLAQWEARVTDANRAKMIKEYMLEARNSFLKENVPPVLTGAIDDYNFEYEFFSINTPNFGTIYASVPASEKDDFRSRWNQVKINPVYGILDGQIAVLDCTFSLDGKEYKSPQQYEEDDLTQMAINITPLATLREYEQMMASQQGEGKNNVKQFEPDVIDIEIPSNPASNTSTFAVIIGNEDYQRVAHVEYALNDARIFAKYCNRTLGLPESNIRTYYNATFGDIVAAMEDIAHISNAYNGDINVIFYYAGHGVPDENNRKAYILPIDATGTQPEVCYPLDKLYEQLGALNAHSVVAFIDACFSGSLRGEGMLASARGIKLRPRESMTSGNMVVLSAASGDQTAMPYHEKNHGLFTYYILKKLNDTKGDVALGDLAEYVTTEVSKQAIVENKKNQKPTVKWSQDMTDKWREIQLR